VGIAGLIKGPVVLAMVGATGGMLIIFHWIDWWLRERQLRQEGARGFEIPGPPGIDFPEPVQLDPLRKSIASELDAPLPGFQTSFKKWALFAAKGLLALVIVVAIVGPWVYLIEQRSPGFLNTSWSTNIVDRIQRGSEGHSGPPGYYLLTIWGTYFPWSLFIPMAIVFAWKRRAMPRIRFALAAVLGPWIMLECVQTKLPHYLLPAFPFLAFLTADALVRCFKNEHDDLIRKSFVGFARGWAVAVIAVFGVGPWLMAYLFRPQPWFGLAVVSLVAIAYGLTVYLLFRAQRLREGIFAMGAGMAALVVAMFTVFLPYAGYLHTSMRVADILKAHGATGAGQVMMQDYKEPSLAFYQGGTIRELSDMRIIPDHTTPWLVTTKEVYDKTPADIRELYEVIDTVKGLAYADGGRVVEVMILRKR
jgi:4-amino-4-deoxy-L-arabinose transferase-like glycosyltransferase